MKHSILKINGGEAAAPDPRVLRSRAGLRQALLELLETAPLDQITIREIAMSAGVGYTTYFRHYANKEELLQDLAAEEIRYLFELTTPIYDAVDAWTSCLALCNYVDQHRAVWSALLTSAYQFVREELLQRIREIAATRPHIWLPGDLGIVLCNAAIVEVIAWWLRQSDPPPPEQIADILDRTVMSPARPTRPQGGSAANSAAASI